MPLVLYLGTFVLAFARRELVCHRLLTRLVAPSLILLAVMSLFSHRVPVLGFVHLSVFALAALHCHGALARLRPPAADLTRYYLLVSAGGLVGGLLVALVAPLAFADVYEYPITLVLVAALLPTAQAALRRVHMVVATVALGLVVVGIAILRDNDGSGDGFSDFAVGCIAVLVVFAAPALLILRA